jgi:hypothetical protein
MLLSINLSTTRWSSFANLVTTATFTPYLFAACAE